MKSSDFAVIRLQGRQYVVSAGETLNVDKLRDPKKLDYDVLLLSKGGKVEVGTPVLNKVKLDIKVENELVKGKKVNVFKYKSKSRYRKRIGFRPQHTSLEVAQTI